MSQRRQMILAAGAAVGVTLLFFVLLLSPKLKEISKTKAERTAAEQEEQSLKTSLLALEETRRDAPAAAARLQKASQFLPSSPDLPGFIRSVQQAATLAGVDLRSIAPSQPSAFGRGTGIDAITVTVVIEGSFFRIEDFLVRLESLRRVVKVNSLGLAPSGDAAARPVLLQSTITMTMFVVQPTAQLGPARTSPGAGASPSPSPTGGAG